MASNLAKGGYQVIAYDADHDRTRHLATQQPGVSQAKSLDQVGAAVDTVITMLPTGHTVRQVLLQDGDGGLARHLRQGSLLIDMSSSDPTGTRQLGADLGKYGIQVLDAPVSGGVPGAVEATLAIMLGGDDGQAIARARPVLSVLGSRIFETGPLGSGHAMKCLNNYVASAGFAAASEALIIGGYFGLDKKIMLDILNVSTGRNFSTEHTMGPNVVDGAFATGFALALLAKDVKIAADLARDLALDTPVLQLVSARYRAALDDLGAGSDFTEAFKFMDQSALPTGRGG